MIKSRFVALVATAMMAGPACAAVSRVEASKTDNTAGGAQEYVDKVESRRAVYGNQDGLRHSTLLNGNRFGFTLGYMDWTNGSNANGPHFGLSYLSSITDNVGFELWGGYGLGTEDTASIKNDVNRLDLGMGVRAQAVMSMGEPARALVPYISVGPVYSYITNDVSTTIAGSTQSVSSNRSAVGFSLASGIDIMMGGISFGVRANYIISHSVEKNGGDMSVFVPQFSAAWAF